MKLTNYLPQRLVAGTLERRFWFWFGGVTMLVDSLVRILSLGFFCSNFHFDWLVYTSKIEMNSLVEKV